jgi:sortase A
MTMTEERADSIAAPIAPTEPRESVREARVMPVWLRSLSISLCILAGLAAWMLLFLGPFSSLKESRAQSTLYAQFRGQLASGVKPPPPFAPNSILRHGDPVAVLTIPAIGIHRMVVVEGSRSGDLENGPGHLPGTVLPGESGVSTLLGRSFAYGGPFSRVATLKSGDVITATTGQGTYRFTVVDSRGPGQPIPGVLGLARSRLTLVSSANRGWRNAWVPTHAIYVDAVLHGKVAPDAPGSTPIVADSPMKADPGSLLGLVLWLQLLLVVVLGLVWLAVRWGRKQIWIVGVPLVVALLWGVSLQFTQLLPNLL